MKTGSDGLPRQQGLYHPKFEHDACGVGFVVNVKGEKSHTIIRQGLTILKNLSHRGAQGSEANSGDGAGILMQLPHAFFKRVCAEAGFELPAPGHYGAGAIFLPHDAAERRRCQNRLEDITRQEGQRVLGWRDIPVSNAALGNTARVSAPVMRHFFIGRSLELADEAAFERKLYVIRKLAERDLRHNKAARCKYFYITNLSARTIVYKGMLLSEQLEEYFPDLSDPQMESALALVHSRFSTNTFPSWERAHPYRFITHNGEINTLQGNVNWLRAQQNAFQSGLFGDDIKKLLPIIDPAGSDSAMFDNVLEFLTLAGRSLPHAVMMMIPEPWSKHQTMSAEKKAFYEFHSALMEPWDGPASIGFTDGARVGAVLDRNGLRPSRYYVTSDDLVVMASEVGVLDIPPEKVLQKGRLEPGRMFLVDTEQGRIISDEEIKHQIASQQPYQQWLDKYLVTLDDLPEIPARFIPARDRLRVTQQQQAFGYTLEDLRLLLAPMAQNGVEPLGAMGNDAPLAVLSDRPQLLFNYFKQLFAQVTNPPIDAIREELVTATEVMLGVEQNLLEPSPRNCRQIKLKTPIMTNAELAKLRYINRSGYQSIKLPILFKAKDGGAGLKQAMDDLCQAASHAIASKAVNILILSDRGIDREHAAIPSLLAVAGLHHHLIREGTRTQIGLVIETGEARETHHFAALIAFGATAINPYLAYESLDDMIRQGLLRGLGYAEAERNYVKAIVKGVVKIISKMGISTIQSYAGAQIFEALGLSQQVIDRYFTGAASRIGGVGLDVIAQESLMRHRRAFPQPQVNGRALDVGGQYKWRSQGERHLFNPKTIHYLQHAARTGNYRLYQKYAALINEQAETPATLRGLLDFKFVPHPIPIAEVEPPEAIYRRFKTGAMSYGSISQEAHESLAIAMNRLGGKSNTGEGGEDPARFAPLPNGDSRKSAIKQVASGRFGVTGEYLASAVEIQIKMAQGAKPGEGGQLPGRKVYPWIAKVRHSTPGVGLISPPPHHDIYSIEDLAELIFDLKNANPRARINVKLVSETGVGTIAAGVAKGHADVILISGYDGGTGASPQSSITHAGLPWELGLAETHQTLVLNNLRSRVRLETDGQLKTGRDVVIAALLGAEEFGFATAPLVTLGCTMMRVCYQDTCPVGIATQNPELRRKFAGKPDYVVNFFHFVAQEVRELMAKLGFRTLDEMVGRVDRLKAKENISHWKAKTLDFSKILHRPDVGEEVGRYCQIAQDHGLEKSLDRQILLAMCAPALERGEPVAATLPIKNTNRVVGTILGNEISRRYGGKGLPEDTIRLRFTGSAGQSFGAFIPKGMTLVLEGDANDYIGKGLSGGKIIVAAPAESPFKAEENIIIGNVAFYGATGGEAYINGVAGERFCVRNSGVKAVVEGVGDHGCEYMTGGRVVILGRTGRNFAAGMSGGIAYVLDERGDFPIRCNTQMVDLEGLTDPADIAEARRMIKRHLRYTNSSLARQVLANWDEKAAQFVKVIPKDYRRMLDIFADVQKTGLSGEEAAMAAFEINKNDLARVSGN